MWEETGHTSQLARNQSAVKMLKALSDLAVERFKAGKPHKLSDTESLFLYEQGCRFEDLSEEGLSILNLSAKQYFWIRDIYNREVLGL